jgi:predicted nucleotidyltransferase
MLIANLPVKQDELTAFCRRHGVSKLSVFGSVLRSDFDPRRSDLDILVEFAPESHKGLFKLVDMQSTLTRMFGREVDLVTPGSLSKYFKDEVISTALVLYDAA